MTMAERKAYKVMLTDEQKETIEIFCNMNEWDLQLDLIQNSGANIAESSQRQNTPVVARQAPQEDVWEDPGAEECIYCFLRPCVTTHRQSWLGGGRTARLANRVTRKTLYEKFWSVMDHRGAWNDPRYLHKKETAIEQADNEEVIVWVKAPKARQSIRKIMPECILKLVRNLYPNPPGVNYMGHKWH